MSTDYYDLHPPLSSYRVTQTQTHCHVDLWADGKNVGRTTFGNVDEARQFVDWFINYDDPVAHSYYGGDGVGQLWERHRAARSRLVVDEYGRTFTAREIKVTPEWLAGSA